MKNATLKKSLQALSDSELESAIYHANASYNSLREVDHITRRKPSKAVQDAQDKLYCLYASLKQEKKDRKERFAKALRGMSTHTLDTMYSAMRLSDGGKQGATNDILDAINDECRMRAWREEIKTLTIDVDQDA